METPIMAAPKKRLERTRHTTLWTVEAVRWEFRKHETERERLLAEKGEEGPGVQLGQRIAGADVEDREFAVAIGHHFLDRFAEEAAGRMSLEVHLHPPLRDVEDENAYKVTDEVLEQARKLGIEGDVEQQVKRMARDGTPYHAHRRANLRHGSFALKVQANDVVWLGWVEPPGRRREIK
jgi:hypothetical protein